MTAGAAFLLGVIGVFVIFLVYIVCDSWEDKAYYTHTYQEAKRREGIGNTIIFITIVIVACLTVWGASLPITYTDTRTNIVSLNDGTGIHGEFVFGSGTVDSTPVYAIYYEVSHDAYKRRFIPAMLTTVYTDEENTPYLMEHRSSEGSTIYDLHVPKNILVKNMVLDNA